LPSGPRRIHIILRNWNIILHISWYTLGWRVNICSNHISLMVLLISTLTWVCCKSGSHCNRKALAFRIVRGSNMTGHQDNMYLLFGNTLVRFSENADLLASFDWPCWHPDLSPSYNLFWGFLKETVPQQFYKTTEYLNQAVRFAFDHVTSQILHWMSHRTWHGIILCHENYRAQTYPHDNYGLYSMV
jgi:hypothetical protein